MHDLRDGKRTALGDLSGGGFFIRRVASPGSLAVRGARKTHPRRFISPSNNKENVPPAVRATTPKRISPLPDWYPRTPLHDITAIVKAIERRRLRIAACQQQSQRPEQEVPHCPKVQDSLGAFPGSSSTQIVASPASRLAKGNLKIFSSPSETSLLTPSNSEPIDPAFLDLRKKLSSSIEQIEKMVRRNLKRTPRAVAQPSKRAIQRCTLMSMR
ncbi:hypothetical protein GUJ93_ZPchr0004g39752 [Zizania palustris]|uniref:Uncharacterized protein n=1 Tax=Zizania palustris TaxID=103762 RepID=A0A8J5SIW3_ZIZPA|nr:hypothetical protein GUJ93_ZPchr0004g39752 [Zizania palustris]